MGKPGKIKTKEKIITEAIAQYNKFGVQGITSRHIASELGISYGNLDYHYKTKEDLLIAIHGKMREEMNALYNSQLVNSSAIENFHLFLLQFEEFQYRYRFFNLDVLEISRSFPKVSQLISDTLKVRKSQTETLFEKFIDEGFLSPNYFEVADRIQHILRMVISFWLSQCEVLPFYKFTDKGEMAKSIWTILNPYLTQTGHKEYQKVVEKYGYIK